MRIVPEHELLGGLERETAAAPLAEAAWYTAHAEGDGVVYLFPAGALARATYLTADVVPTGGTNQ